MSKKSQSNNQNHKEQNQNADQAASDDQNFWNLESDPQDIETPAEELEEIDKILAEKKLNQPLKQISEREVDIELPCDKEIMSSLERHKGGEKIEELPDISNKDVDEILASANAEALAEGSDSAPAPASVPAPLPTKPKSTKSPAEKIATICCYIAIIAIFGYLIKYASNQHDFNTAKSYAANTPAQGEFGNIVSIETWWSEPVGNNTKYGVILVPAATISLAPDSTSGVIRSVFYSYEEGLQGKLRPKGDPFTHEFRDGKFLTSGTNQITIYGTDGFTELSNFIFYRGQDDERWTIDIKEAPSVQTDVNSFKFLAQAPIEPIRK
ncbi:MAG: hypothetical protein ACSHX6_10155 [Akkermansiaceae bacterium]